MEGREGPKEITERIEADVESIMKMYDSAEQVYSYNNLRGERSLNENEQR